MTEKKLKWFRVRFENKGHRGDCSLPAEDIEDAKNTFRQEHPWFGQGEVVVEEIHD